MSREIDNAIEEKNRAGHQLDHLLKWVVETLQEQADSLGLPPEEEERFKEWAGAGHAEIARRLAQNLADELADKTAVQPSLAFLGPAGAGKSTLVNVLFGKPLADVGPATGTTVTPGRWSHRMGVDILDTPGFLGLDAGLEEEVVRLLPEMDIRILVVDVTSVRGDDIRLAQQLHRRAPFTASVVNKIDLPPPEELSSVVDQIRRHLPPIKTVEISAIRGDNIDLFIRCLYEALPHLKQRLLFIGWLNDRREAIAAEIETLGKAKAEAALHAGRILEEITEAREKTARVAIQNAAVKAGAIGVIPLPGADIVPLMTLQHRLIIELAVIFGYEDARARLGAVFGPLAAGGIGRALFRQILKLAPGAGDVAAGVVAAAGTYAVGMTALKIFRDDLSPEEAKKILEAEMDSAFERYLNRELGNRR